jgi:cephalosporin hydroxylase
VIHENQPDFIVETGTKHGGSACFFADVLNITGNGHVVTIDTNDHTYLDHPNITYLRGSSVDLKIVSRVKDIVGNGSVMVSLDSDHRPHYVKRELQRYSEIVTEGQYLVVEDLCDRRGLIRKERGPAVEEFLERDSRYIRVRLDQQFPATVTKYGWLRR